jgi:hypothetical protein
VNKTAEELREIDRWIHDTVEKHLGIHWKVKYTKAKKSFGTCSSRRKYTKKDLLATINNEEIPQPIETVGTIKLSLYHIDQHDFAEIKDTVLHEIAHALVGTKEGHNKKWKAACVKLGCRPEKAARVSMKTPYAIKYECPKCGNVAYAHRRYSKYAKYNCGHCKTPVNIYRGRFFKNENR